MILRLSIATRVSLACSGVLILSLLLLAVGLSVGNSIRKANGRVEALSDMLGQISDHGAAQVRLRLAVGDLTRAAEAGKAVPVERWELLSRQIDAFEQDYILPAAGGPASSVVSERALGRARFAALRFAANCRRLLATARSNSAAVKSAMPPFLASLKATEQANLEASAAVTRQIAETAKQNARESDRDIYSVLAGGLVIITIFFWMTVWLRSQLLAPIEKIATSLREFDNEKANTAIPGLARADELGDLARGLAEYRAAVDERRSAERRAAFLAHHDTLTGLANRLLFEDRLAHELVRARRSGDRVAVFAIDVDNFKAINDRLGHAGGDRALRRMADLLAGSVRSDDLVARLGGDEFAIIQVAPSQPAAAEALVSRLFTAMRATVSEEIALRASIGIAISHSEWEGENLYDLADLALYRAKSAGRNTARFFDASLKEQESLRVQLARDLEQALAANELHLVYQPIADTRSLEIRGFEALLRWKHPLLGEIPPDRFIPIAESAGLIDGIGAWVAEQAMAAAALWPEDIALSLNLSPIQFRRPGLAAQLLRIAQESNLAFARLEFEVTESATLLGFHREEVLLALRSLQQAGARIVMDDFGTGHSSLSNLKDFTFDKLKIDRSFVGVMCDHAPSASIVRATIGLGKSLGLTIVAEGVEDQAQLAQLREWGCDQVQGFLVGRPEDVHGFAPEQAWSCVRV